MQIVQIIHIVQTTQIVQEIEIVQIVRMFLSCALCSTKVNLRLKIDIMLRSFMHVNVLIECSIE